MTLEARVNGTNLSGWRTVILNGTAALPAHSFGGNAIWGEYFTDRLDEIRICDRALTAAEIQADQARAVP